MAKSQVSPQDFGCGKYVEDSKKDPYRGSESYNCSCLYQNDESWEIDHNSKECHFHVIFTPNYGVTQTWAVSSFFISLVIAGNDLYSSTSRAARFIRCYIIVTRFICSNVCIQYCSDNDSSL